MTLWSFEPVADLLQEAAFDSARWPAALDALSRSVGGAGAVLLPADHPIEAPIVSPNLRDMMQDYSKGEWVARDERYRGALLLRKRTLVDQDFLTPDEIDRSAYYQDFIGKHKLRWFAALAFAPGDSDWMVSIQRTPAQGPFLADEVERLTLLTRPLSDAATLARSFSAVRLEGVVEAMELIGQPAMALDGRGRPLAVNAAAEPFSRRFLDLAEGSLRFGDAASAARFSALLRAAAPFSGGPARAVVRDRDGARHGIRMVALRGLARFAFTGASALLLFEAPRLSGEAALATLRAAFGLTPAEARLAVALSGGASLKAAAREVGIAYATARSYLNVIFLKTDTHRQGELAALLMTRLL